MVWVNMNEVMRKVVLCQWKDNLRVETGGNWSDKIIKFSFLDVERKEKLASQKEGVSGKQKNNPKFLIWG